MKRCAVLLLIVFVVASCKNLGAKFSELNEIHDDLENEFGFQDIKVQLHNDVLLHVSLMNSVYNDSSDAAKQKLADSIGIISLRHMHAIKPKGGTVTFAKGGDPGIAYLFGNANFSMHLPK